MGSKKNIQKCHKNQKLKKGGRMRKFVVRAIIKKITCEYVSHFQIFLPVCTYIP